jgi:transposase
MVPILDSSGLNGRYGGPTKRGDAVLRQALFIAAGQGRRIDLTRQVSTPHDRGG